METNSKCHYMSLSKSICKGKSTTTCTISLIYLIRIKWHRAKDTDVKNNKSGGNINDMATVENSMEVPQKIKNRNTI